MVKPMDQETVVIEKMDCYSRSSQKEEEHHAKRTAWGSTKVGQAEGSVECSHHRSLYFCGKEQVRQSARAFGLATLTISHGHWGIGNVPRYLVPGPGVIRA